MIGENRILSEKELDEINSRKTGALLTAACMMGVAAAGGNDKQLEAAGMFGAAIGAAFQIRDDMLDVISTSEQLGKPIGSDIEENKNTYMALLGAERCMEMIKRLTQNAKRVLTTAFDDTQLLCELADSMVTRLN